MRSKVSSAVRLLVLAGMALSIPAFAQCLPDLTGRWTFRTSDNMMAGQFLATAGSTNLSFVTTTVTGQGLTRSDGGTGSYALNADCVSGVFFINSAWAPRQWSFTIANDATFGRVITFRSTVIPGIPGPAFNSPDPFAIPRPLPTASQATVGNAWPAPSACPAGISPSLNLLSGIYNMVTLSGVTGSTTSGGGGAIGSLVGRIEIGAALAPSWLERGLLVGFLTPTYVAVGSQTAPQLPNVPTPPNMIGQLPVVPNYGAEGQYTVSADCRRGTITLNFDHPRSIDYDVYSRVSAAGVFSYVVLGANTNDPVPTTFLASGGTIAR